MFEEILIDDWVDRIDWKVYWMYDFYLMSFEQRVSLFSFHTK